MTVRNLRSRPQRLALCLTVLALFAQLWLGQVSTGHLAQLLAAGAGWGDVCSAAGPHEAPGSDTGHAATLAQHCPVCGVAAASLLPGDAPALPQALPAWARRALPVAAAPLRDLRQAGLRPPAQAPPTA